jgi:hypothetical protein
MGLLLAISKIYVPQFLRKRQLDMLLGATAEAFQVTAPSTGKLSYIDCLKLYARFTREQAERSIDDGSESEMQVRLFQSAYRIGQRFKADFHLNTVKEVMEMSELIYGILKIDFQGDSLGNIQIKRCFFSDYYSPAVCRLISSLDAGLLIGLSGSGKLNFSQRITEGNNCCRAYLSTSRESK